MVICILGLCWLLLFSSFVFDNDDNSLLIDCIRDVLPGLEHCIMNIFL